MALEPWQLFWAKTDRSKNADGLLVRPEWTHPLWAHLIDVAHVAEALADRLPQAIQAELAGALDLSWERSQPLLALLLGLHDAGKAIPSFQSAHPASRDALRGADLALLDRYPDASDRRHHGHASIPILHRWLDGLALPPVLYTLAAFVGFHHGRLDPKKNWDDRHALGDAVWKRQQQALVQHVADAWMAAHGGWPHADTSPDAKRSAPPAALALAGWTTLADWIGSMSEHMPPDATRYERIEDYLPASREAAQAALVAAHLHQRAALQAESTVADFKTRFPDTFGRPGARPHRLQALAATIALPDAPALVVVEAPTGEGKTEAAFYLAARLQARRGDGKGVYVALPTQATSNGLFPRFTQFLERAHDSAAGDAAVMLVHGASGLNADLDRLVEPQDEDDASVSRTYAARWFLAAKRGLLAPYAVGTVDQALMGAVTSRHFFLRLYGLAGKTVVFDEVHAYDGYMAALFTRLLVWLRHLGADVVVLTATLPLATRRALFAAWDAPDAPAAYPALAVAEAGRTDALAVFEGDFETRQSARTTVTFGNSDPAAVAERVRAAVSRGATVGVIVNRVDRAQEVFRHLEDGGEHLDADLHLLHARFPFDARDARERAALYRFGKEGRGEATCPAVLVATQVAEQSLDLDVDLMLSDLAPVDLLLQRAGRLHRHHLPRPEGYEDPRFVVLRPPLSAPDALPDVSAIGGQFRPDNPDGIYLDLPLFRTELELRPRVYDGTGWSLPHDYRPLIEAVYGDGADDAPPGLSPADRARWDAAVASKNALGATVASAAEMATVEEPARLGDLLKSGHYANRTRYDEDDDTPARNLKPQTRLGGPSVQVVCLHRRGERIWLDPDGSVPLPTGPRLSAGETRAVLRRGVRLSRRRLVDDLEREAVPEWWAAIVSKTPALAYHRPLVFESRRCTVGRTVVELHPDLGIRYDPDDA